jgi:hypothetical protein
MELTQHDLLHLLQRFPSFELSYETITHKKVPPSYDICLGIPSGKKYFLWFTFYRDQDVCYLMELNKEKRVVRATVTYTGLSRECHIGTVLYGSLVRDETTNTERAMIPYFVLEDIYFYKGIPLKPICFAHKLQLCKQIFSNYSSPVQMDRPGIAPKHITPVYLPFMWNPSNSPPNFPYTIHHIQYRELFRICPHLNVIYGLRESFTHTTPVPSITAPTEIYISKYIPEYHRPQYKLPTVFRVMADIQYDIYHLYAYGNTSPTNSNTHSSSRDAPIRKDRSGIVSKRTSQCNPEYGFVYYDVAYIPNYEKSVFMNTLFRNIRENSNLDYIEESDDEDDFENTSQDKYVDRTKQLFIECVFHTKFKRWVPMRVVDHSQAVHINKLARV